MNLPNKKIADNEVIIFRVRRHWAVLVLPLFLIAFGALTIQSKGAGSVAILAAGIVWGALSFIDLRTSELTLTRTGPFIQYGFPLRRSYDIRIADITTVSWFQPYLGAMLNFGTIVVKRNGNRKNRFRVISNPAEFARRIEEQIAAARGHEQKTNEQHAEGRAGL